MTTCMFNINSEIVIYLFFLFLSYLLSMTLFVVCHKKLFLKISYYYYQSITLLLRPV